MLSILPNTENLHHILCTCNKDKNSKRKDDDAVYNGDDDKSDGGGDDAGDDDDDDAGDDGECCHAPGCAFALVFLQGFPCFELRQAHVTPEHSRQAIP